MEDRTYRGALTAIMCAILATSAVSAAPMASAVGRQGQIVEDASASKALSESIRSEIGSLPPQAASQDIEGVIVFAISQSNYRTNVVANALDAVGLNAPINVVQALSNVRLALLQRRVVRGTAAIEGGRFGSNLIADGLGFSTPGISTGNGLVNYAR